MAKKAPSPITGGLARFIWAIKMQESGGNYHAVSSAGALGAYQIMPGNIPSWSRAALGFSITPQQFISNPRWQDKIAEFKLGSYYRQYGPRGAAAAWYSGQPNPNATFGNPPVDVYVQQVMARMGHAPSSIPGSTNVGGTGGTGGTPGPGGGGGGTPAQTTGFASIPSNLIGGVLGQAIGTGIEFGVTTAFEDILTTWWHRLKWMGEIVIGFVGTINIFLIIIIWVAFDKIMSNKEVAGSIAAAPASGGMSLLLGAGAVARQNRIARQERAEERAQQRLVMAQERAGRAGAEQTERIDIARRRVTVQERAEERRQGVAFPKLPNIGEQAEPTQGINLARERVNRLIEERKRLIKEGLGEKEIRERLRNIR